MLFPQTQKTFLLTVFTLLVYTSQGRAEAVTSISVNGADTAEVVAGSPVIVSVTLTDTTELANRDWKLQISGVNGEAIDAAPTLRRKEDPVQVSGIYSQSVIWTINPEATAKLPKGDYLVRSGEGKPATLHIVDAAPAQNDTDKVNSLLLFSEFTELDGRLEDALEAANSALAINSDSLAASLRKCDVLMAKEQWATATEILEQAALVSQKKSTIHIPLGITSRQQEIQAKLDAQ